MAKQLSAEGKRLLGFLVGHLPSTDPDDPATFLTYKEVHSGLGLKLTGSNIGTSLQAQGLNDLTYWIQENNLPALTGLIVRESERDPGKGFFSVYGKDQFGDIKWWLSQIGLAKKFDWSLYLDLMPENVGSGAPKSSKAPEIQSHTDLTIADLAKQDSHFFLKSEYGPLSIEWPVVAFTKPQVKAKLQRDYKTGSDFIVYTGTGGSATIEEQHRGRLLSVMRIDKTRAYRTETRVDKKAWKWAQENYPGQWTYSFPVLEGWSIVGQPFAKEVVPLSYSKIGKYPFRGSVLEISEGDHALLLELRVTPLSLPTLPDTGDILTRDRLLQDKVLNEVANRLAGLIFNRVTASGKTSQHLAPTRSAPLDTVLRVAELLRVEPLTCSLCGGVMELKPTNRLLQPSPDRIDSKRGDYGPDNFHLSHLACNLGKNDATLQDFEEWIGLVRDVTTDSDTHE